MHKKGPPLETGFRSGKLVTVELMAPDARGQKRWKVQCDCGSERVHYETNLRRLKVQSCGCAAKQRALATRLANGNDRKSRALARLMARES